jgi:hypothetical protein
MAVLVAFSILEKYLLSYLFVYSSKLDKYSKYSIYIKNSPISPMTLDEEMIHEYDTRKLIHEYYPIAIWNLLQIGMMD